MRVGVDAAATWTASTPTMVIKPGYFTVPPGNPGRTYDVSPDGQRFLMIKQSVGSDQTAAPVSLVVIQHFDEELKAKVPLP